MDLPPEELQFLSTNDILKESSSIPKQSPKTFYLITVTLIFRLSFVTLSSPSLFSPKSTPQLFLTTLNGLNSSSSNSSTSRQDEPIMRLGQIGLNSAILKSKIDQDFRRGLSFSVLTMPNLGFWSIKQHSKDRRHCLEAQRAARAATGENGVKGSHLDVKFLKRPPSISQPLLRCSSPHLSRNSRSLNFTFYF